MLARFFTRIRTRPLLQKVVYTAGWQVADKIVRMGVGLVVGVWVARYLGPADFGLLNFGVAFVAIFTPIADGGLQVIVVRELVRRQSDEQKILASALILRLSGACAALACCVGCVLVLRPSDVDAHLVVLVIALSLFAQSWDVIDFAYQSRMQPRPVVVIRIVSLLIFALIKIALMILNAPLIAFAWVIVGEAALGGLLMRMLVSMRSRAFTLRDAKWAEMKQLIAVSWPMAVSALSIMLYMRIDQVMLGQLLDDEAVGLFSAAVRLSESWYFIPMAMVAAVAPALTSAHSSSQCDYYNKLTAVTRTMLLLSLGVAAALTFFSGQLIDMLYGSMYAGAAPVLALHAWAGVFASLGIATGPWFVNSGMVKFRMMHTLIGALVNIAMNFYMIPRFGVVGAAVSTLVSYAMAAVGLNVLSRKTWPVAALQVRAILPMIR